MCACAQSGNVPCDSKKYCKASRRRALRMSNTAIYKQGAPPPAHLLQVRHELAVGPGPQLARGQLEQPEPRGALGEHVQLCPGL
eukprot:1557306-Alexandrium_andersonii.AAC.1